MKYSGGAVVLLCGVALGGAAWAVDDEADLELLEYLGSWDGEDDEWNEFFDSIPDELVEDADDSDTTHRETTSRSVERDSD